MNFKQKYVSTLLRKMKDNGGTITVDTHRHTSENAYLLDTIDSLVEKGRIVLASEDKAARTATYRLTSPSA